MANEREPLPPMENALDLSNLFVDATPDGSYALRILEAFRQRCNVCYRVSGLDEGHTALYEAMNQMQEQRAEELDRAIDLLTAHVALARTRSG